MTDKHEAGAILVPVDFSSFSEAALIWAADLAHSIAAPLLILHVVHDQGESPGYYAIKGYKKQLRRMEDVASEMLESFVQKAAKKCHDSELVKKARANVVIGLPVNRILEMAEHEKASMIVMGSHGRTGLAHILLGSKAEQVVHLSKIPVTVVKSTK